MRLPDPDRSYAVLIGASRYHDAELPDLPAVSNNVTALALALTNSDYGGFATDHCAIVSNPDSLRATYRKLRESASLATDTLLVYFAGHGLLGPVKQDLYFALPDTEIGELEVSALPFDIVRQVFLNSRATNRILILDCCFSGRAVHDVMATKTDAVLGQAEIAGSYTLASVPGNALSLAPAGQRFTVFTGALLDLLNHGAPDGPELLSLGTIYTRLRHAMHINGLPLPSQRGTDTVDQLALTRNPAAIPPRPAPLVVDDPPVPRRSHVKVVAASVTVVVTVIVTIVMMIANSPDTTANSPSPSPVAPAANSSSSSPSSKSFKWVPVRVYNNSAKAGLGRQASTDFKASGWNVVEVSNFPGTLTTSAAYYQSATAEEPAAKELAAEFGLRTEPRFAGIQNAAPGVIVIITKDYYEGNG